jgi:hypothetical protein
VEGRRNRKKQLVERATKRTDTVIHTFFLYWNEREGGTCISIPNPTPQEHLCQVRDGMSEQTWRHSTGSFHVQFGCIFFELAEQFQEWVEEEDVDNCHREKGQ